MMNKQPMELYIHIPFCERKCNYCDFLSFKCDPHTKKRYVEQLIAEIRAQAANYQDYHIRSIFIGGGTPSTIQGIDISNIMSAVYEVFAVDAAAEITIECNPGTLSQEKLEYYRQAGINRISLGLQSTDDKELKLLGRIHTYEDFLKTYQLVREAGFDNVNVDLMSALPGQTLEGWRSTIKKVAMLKPEHISAYSLIIEEGTPFYKTYGTSAGRLLLPREEEDIAMYRLTKDMLEEYDYHRYEISNYAKPGKECVHNIGYWTGVEYLGVGLGASSYMMNHRWHSEKNLTQYLSIDLKRDITPLYKEVTELTKDDRMEEFMFLGLRMMQGVSGSEFMHRFNENMFNVYAEAIERNVRMHLLEVNNPYIRLTSRGVEVSNTVMGDFML